MEASSVRPLDGTRLARDSLALRNVSTMTLRPIAFLLVLAACLAPALGRAGLAQIGAVARMSRLREEVRLARGPFAYAALRKVWSEWDRSDPTEIEEVLASIATDRAEPAPVRTYAGLLQAYARRRRGLGRRAIAHREAGLRRCVDARRALRQRGQGRPCHGVRPGARAHHTPERRARLRRQEPSARALAPAAGGVAVCMGRLRRVREARGERLRLRDDVRP